MTKELIAGVSFSGNAAQTVILEVQPDGIELHHLEEFQNKSNNDIWFLDGILGARNDVGTKVSKIAVALDNAGVFLHSFPLDSSLTQPEQNEHVQWELSNYIDGFKPKDYINDIHVLRTHAREQISEILAVCVRRSLAFNIQNTLVSKKLDLQLVDTNHFCSQYALLVTHTEVKTKIVALADVTNNRVDVGILMNGRLTNYRYALSATVNDAVTFIENQLKTNSLSDVYLCGSGVSFELAKALRSRQGINVATLNPFRKIRIAPSFRGFDKFIGQEHRFASCVGAVLGK